MHRKEDGEEGEIDDGIAREKKGVRIQPEVEKDLFVCFFFCLFLVSSSLSLTSTFILLPVFCPFINTYSLVVQGQESSSSLST